MILLHIAAYCINNPTIKASCRSSHPDTTFPDASTCADALAILQKFNIDAPPEVLRHLQSAQAETPKAGDARFGRHSWHVIASARQALAAAARTNVNDFRAILIL